MVITMKKLFIILPLLLVISACEPHDTYNDCRGGAHEAGNQEDFCGLMAFVHMFHPRDW